MFGNSKRGKGRVASRNSRFVDEDGFPDPYEVRTFRSEPLAYECVRREDLEPKTGIRVSRAATVRRRWCR